MLTDSDRVDAATVRAGARDHIKKVKPDYDDDDGEEGHMKKMQGHWTLQQCSDFIKGGKVGDEDNLIPVPVCFRGCIYSLLIPGRIRLVLLKKQFIIYEKSFQLNHWDLGSEICSLFFFC